MLLPLFSVQRLGASTSLPRESMVTVTVPLLVVLLQTLIVP
jgi:hypothetical protein